MPASMNASETPGEGTGAGEAEREQGGAALDERLAHRQVLDAPEDEREAGERQGQPGDEDRDQAERGVPRQPPVPLRERQRRTREHPEHAPHRQEDPAGDDRHRGPREHDRLDRRRQRDDDERRAERDRDDAKRHVHAAHPARTARDR